MPINAIVEGDSVLSPEVTPKSMKITRKAQIPFIISAKLSNENKIYDLDMV